MIKLCLKIWRVFLSVLTSWSRSLTSLFWSELWRVFFLVIFTIIDSFTTNANLMLTISMLNLELYLLNWNFFQSFCFILCLNLTFSLALQRETELSKLSNWLCFEIMWLFRAGYSNCRRLRRQKQTNFRANSQSSMTSY